MRIHFSQDVTFYLGRHAQSRANAHGDIIGDDEAPLTDEGRRQAEHLCDYLFKHPIKGSMKIFCSDMPRAVETMQIIQPAFDQTCTIDPRLREIRRGDWEKASRSAILEKHGDMLLALGMDHRPPNGESMNDVATRVLGWLHERREEIESRTYDTYFVLGHGIAHKTLIQRIFSIEPSYAWMISLDNTSISKIRCTAKGWRLDYLNATPHLAGKGF